MSWEDKLTVIDEGLFRMVKGLTGQPCEPKNGDDCYFIVVPYPMLDADYIGAVMAAIEGRVGERLVKFVDEPESNRFIVFVKFCDGTEDTSFVPKIVKE